MILDMGSSELKLIDITSTCHNYKLIREYLSRIQLKCNSDTHKYTNVYLHKYKQVLLASPLTFVKSREKEK